MDVISPGLVVESLGLRRAGIIFTAIAKLLYISRPAIRAFKI
jgi:hypothetical protein